MWEIKKFKNREKYEEFIENNKNKIQYENIFINNAAYAIEYRKLKKVY